VLHAQPIKEQRRTGALRNLARVQWGVVSGLAFVHPQPLRQHPRAALIGDCQSLLNPALLHQQMNVVVVDAGRVSGKGKPRVFILELRPCRFEVSQRGFIASLCLMYLALPLKQPRQLIPCTEPR